MLLVGYWADGKDAAWLLPFCVRRYWGEGKEHYGILGRHIIHIGMKFDFI
jgi:hypothetical protein